MEGSEEEDYAEDEWDYESEIKETPTESVAENDVSTLPGEESSSREGSWLEDEVLNEEGGEELELVELNIENRINVSDAEYPGEYEPVVLGEEFEEDEINIVPPKLKRASRTATQVASDRSKASLRVKIQEEPDRLRVVRLKPKTCIKDRMRKWLNRDHNQPPTESFLGRPYSERTKSLDRLDDPCHYIFFKRFSPYENQDKSEIGKIYLPGWRPLCGCHGKIEDINKKHAKVLIKDESPSPTKDSSSVGTSEGRRKRFKCTCGESESCFGLSPPASPNVTKSFQEVEAPELPRDQGKKPEPCTCDKKDDAGGWEEDEDALVREKLHHLMNLWFELKQRVCYCKKSGWMATRVWGRRKKKRCICKKIQKKRAKLLRMMEGVRDGLTDRRIEMEERKIREEKINELYKLIGPDIAAQYKALSEMHRPHQKEEPDPFTKMVMKEFGGQLRKYRMQNLQDGSIHREHRRGDYDSLQYVELPNGSKYFGQFSQLGMEGKCIYKMVHGPVYVGSMVDGKMEGQGKLIYPNGGIVEGTWVNGTLFDPKYTFSDGLKFRPYNWKYCRMPDRRFVSEIVNEMKSPDNVQLSADHPARQIPKGCLDAGEGFYDPQKRVIIHPSTGKIIRIVGEQEGNWILQNCRREWFEEVPFSRYMYENWYAGTVFPPPGDEPDWFDKEFAKVLLPYASIDDVLQARRLAMEAASKPSAGLGEPGYGEPFVLPPLNLK